jgi:hypothetical protein
MKLINTSALIASSIVIGLALTGCGAGDTKAPTADKGVSTATPTNEGATGDEATQASAVAEMYQLVLTDAFNVNADELNALVAGWGTVAGPEGETGGPENEAEYASAYADMVKLVPQLGKFEVVANAAGQLPEPARMAYQNVMIHTLYARFDSDIVTRVIVPANAVTLSESGDSAKVDMTMITVSGAEGIVENSIPSLMHLQERTTMVNHDGAWSIEIVAP